MTTVRFGDPRGLKLSPIESNHTEIVLHLNNSDGQIPFTSHSEHAVFSIPMDNMWTDGQSMALAFKLMATKGNPWTTFGAYCHHVLYVLIMFLCKASKKYFFLAFEQ